MSGSILVREDNRSVEETEISVQYAYGQPDIEVTIRGGAATTYLTLTSTQAEELSALLAACVNQMWRAEKEELPRKKARPALEEENTLQGWADIILGR